MRLKINTPSHLGFYFGANNIKVFQLEQKKKFFCWQVFIFIFKCAWLPDVVPLILLIFYEQSDGSFTISYADHLAIIAPPATALNVMLVISSN